MDVAPVFGHRQRAACTRVLHQADDPVGRELPAQGQQRADRHVGDRSGSLVRGDRDAVDRRYVDGDSAVIVRRRAGGHLAEPAAQRAHGRLQAAARQEREQREHALVDRAGGDVVAAAGIDADAWIGEHVPLQVAL